MLAWMPVAETKMAGVKPEAEAGVRENAAGSPGSALLPHGCVIPACLQQEHDKTQCRG